MIPTKRYAFNFLRSYFDVFNELKEDIDKLNFLTAIINKQFLDEDPKDLNFITKLCYESQRHAIEKSVKGWKSIKKTDLLGYPPKVTPKVTPKTLANKSKYKSKNNNNNIDFDNLLIFINTTLGKSYKVINKSIQAKYNARLKDGYTNLDIKAAIENAYKDKFHKDENYKYLTVEYFSRAKTLDMFCSKAEVKKIYKPIIKQRYV